MASGPILGTEMASKSRPQGAPEALPDGYYSEMEKHKVLASVLLILSTRPRYTLTVKKNSFFKASHSLSLLEFAHHPSLRRLQKSFQEQSMRCPKTLPDDASN